MFFPADDFYAYRPKIPHVCFIDKNYWSRHFLFGSFAFDELFTEVSAFFEPFAFDELLKEVSAFSEAFSFDELFKEVSALSPNTAEIENVLLIWRLNVIRWTRSFKLII